MTTYKKGRVIMIASALLLSLVAFRACKTDSNGDLSGELAHLNLYLIDAPAEYDAVNIDIQEIEIHTDEDGWKTYNLVHPGIYNLLEFNAGVDTLMLSEDMPPRTVSQIRLILGENNNVVVDGVSYPLEVPSGETSGLKLNVHYEFLGGIVYDLWLDFDANQSINQLGNGDYQLKPVIRIYTSAETGAISGVISPIDGAISAKAISADDTVTSSIAPDGAFYIGGLSAGLYDVFFEPAPGFTEYSIYDVNVSIGVITDLGVVSIPE